MQVIGWRCWYADETLLVHAVNSKTTLWEDIPSTGMQSVRLYFDENAPDGKPLAKVISGAEYGIGMKGTGKENTDWVWSDTGPEKHPDADWKLSSTISNTNWDILIREIGAIRSWQ